MEDNDLCPPFLPPMKHKGIYRIDKINFVRISQKTESVSNIKPTLNDEYLTFKKLTFIKRTKKPKHSFKTPCKDSRPKIDCSFNYSF